MRVLITGAAGFVGSHVADALIGRGDDVWGIDNYETGLEGNVDSAVTFIQGDIVDEHVVDKLLTEADPHVIVHAAATYRDPDAWDRDMQVNAGATAMIADRAAELNAHLVYFQTSLCYGSVPSDTPIHIEHPLAPTSSYAISKVAGEQYIRLSGCDAAVFRLANMYGPRNLSGPVPAFWKRLEAGSACTVVDARRDFVHISDLVRLVLHAIDDRASGTWHASTGGDYSISELFDVVVKEGGYEDAAKTVVARGDDDVATLLLDPAATFRRFHWLATTSLEAGVGSALDWYAKHGVTDTYTHLKMED